MIKNYQVFTEAYNCGKMIAPMLESFHRYHPNNKMVIFATKKDFDDCGLIIKHPNNICVDVGEDQQLRELYKNGHAGTAYIFAKVLNGEYLIDQDITHVIHVDSDLYFRKESLSLLTDELENGIDIVGSIRNYKKNPQKRSDISYLDDVISTYFMGFRIGSVPTNNYSFEQLMRMCQGAYNPLGHTTLDFFDPVTFVALRNSASIKFIDFELIGGSCEAGHKENKYELLNKAFDCGDNVMHFAGIGSGYNFYHNGSYNVPESYTKWATERYFLFAKVFFNEELGSYDQNLYQEIMKTLGR